MLVLGCVHTYQTNKTKQNKTIDTGILAGVLWLDAARVAALLKRVYGALSSLVTGDHRRPNTRYTYMRAPSGRRVPAPSAPPAGGVASAPPACGNGGGVEDELLREAIRRSLAEQQQGQQRPQQPAQAHAVVDDVYRPSAPHVPVATVVDHGTGPRLPSYEEATARRGRRG